MSPLLVRQKVLKTMQYASSIPFNFIFDLFRLLYSHSVRYFKTIYSLPITSNVTT